VTIVTVSFEQDDAVVSMIKMIILYLRRYLNIYSDTLNKDGKVVLIGRYSIKQSWIPILRKVKLNR
jgi:hypothetical protein